VPEPPEPPLLIGVIIVIAVLVQRLVAERRAGADPT
jgi:hypothetical protein